MSSNNKPENGTTNPQEKNYAPAFKPNQYKRDWAYATRYLSKGAKPQLVEKDIAAYRTDLADPEKYARETVAKVQTYLEVQKELKSNLPTAELPSQLADFAALDENLKRLSDLEFARQLYDNQMGAMVSDSLQKDRGYSPEEASQLAKEAEMRFNAEKDLDFAIRAKTRGLSNDKIIPEITGYRDKQVSDPYAYANAILQAAEQVRDVERDIPNQPIVLARVEVAQRQYGRDLDFAVRRLEERSRNDVRLEVQEIRPEKALESPSYRMHGQPDHTYTVAVVQQAEKIRVMQAEGKDVEQSIDVAQKEFGRHLREVYHDRQRGQSRSEIIARISEGAPSREFYARAIINEAETMREHARELSIRPELARAALDQSVPRPQPVQAREAVLGTDR